MPRGLKWWILGVGACLVLAGGSLLLAQRSLLAGAGELRLAARGVDAGSLHGDPIAALKLARIHTLRARQDFDRANLVIQPLGPVLRLLGWVPREGPRLAAAPDAATLADATSAGLADLFDGLQPLVLAWSHHTHPPIQRTVSLLAGSTGRFTSACNQFRQARAARASLGGRRVPGLASALQTVDRQLPRLQALCLGLALTPRLAGVVHPARYLLAFQNPDELRSTGGFIGSAALISVSRGLVSEQFQGTGIQDNLSLPPPEPVLLYNQEGAWLFRDSNWSPDFPTTAALERFFYRLDLHGDAPDVINVTPQATADLLKATGPLYLPEYHRTVTGANVAALADYYAHWSPTVGPEHFANGDTQRKQFIGIVARRLLGRLKGASLGQWLQASRAVATAVKGGDLLINFREPAMQPLAQALGADGRVRPGGSDFVYVVDTNLSYNKINPYVHETVRYAVTVRPNRWLDARLRIQLTNVPAPPRIATYGYGPGAGRLGKPDDYADFVRIYVPAGAQLTQQSGWRQPWTPGPAYGATMFCGYIIVRRGQTKTIDLRYVLPPNVFVPTGGKRYRLLMPHQPGSHPDAWDITLQGSGVPARHWHVAHPHSVWLGEAPVQKRLLSPIPLPRATYPVVAPGHWIEPHAYLGYPRP